MKDKSDTTYLCITLDIYDLIAYI